MKPVDIVTKGSLRNMIAADPVKVIGRALVAIFNNQTEEEKSGNFTKILNGKGFTQADGRIGALCAKYYLAHGTLEDWQLKIWQTCGKGYPHICKYAKQLNVVALRRNSMEESKELKQAIKEALISNCSKRTFHNSNVERDEWGSEELVLGNVDRAVEEIVKIIENKK